MKRSKLLTSVLVVMMIISMSGVSAFADEIDPVVEEPAAVEEPATDEPVLDEETVVEPEVSYLRFDVGSDLVFVAEDGVIVSVTTELDLNAEEPEAPAEEPEAPAEEPEAPAEEPVDPYAEYLGLSVAEGIDLLLFDNEFEGPVELDIFANGEVADELMTMLEEKYAEQLTLKAVALDSDNPNADRFLQAAVYRITPGKMNLLEKLGANFNEAEIDYAAWSVLSVKEIQAMTKVDHSAVQSAVKEKVKTNNGRSKAKNK